MAQVFPRSLVDLLLLKEFKRESGTYSKSGRSEEITPYMTVAYKTYVYTSAFL